MPTPRRTSPSRPARTLPACLAALGLIAACGGTPAPRDGSADVGAAGGTVVQSSGARLDVPSGALSGTTTLTVQPSGVTAPSGAPIFTLGPDGTTFAKAVTVTLPLPSGVASPAVYWSRPGSSTSFEVVPATVTADGVVAQGTHFSSVFVGPSEGDAVCVDAGAGSDGTGCGGGRLCTAGVCGATVSGTISGEAVAGVTVTLGGAATGSTTTDDAGHYTFPALAPGDYTLTPSYAGVAFTPATAQVTVTGPDVGGLDFAAWRPVLSSVEPQEGHVGATVTLTGSLFGEAGAGGTATLGGVAMSVVSWSDTQIVATVPAGAGAGGVQVHVGSGDSAPLPFTVTALVSGLLTDGQADGLAGNWAFAGDGSPAQLTVSDVATGRATVAQTLQGGAYGALPRAFTLDLPVGTHTLVVQDADASGGATVDLLQAASRSFPGVVVSDAGVSGLELPLHWHWEVHALDPGYPVCGLESQLWFRDAQHGMVTFRVGPDVDPTLDPTLSAHGHGMAMVTGDGGQTWTEASADMSPTLDPFYPYDSGWFADGFLLTLGDGTALSIGDAGLLVRSTDFGQTWTPGGLGWSALGPAGPTPTRFAQAGDRLWVTVTTGGVQGSVERSSLVTSIDEGLTWTAKFDVCNSTSYAPGGCATQGVPLGFAGIDMACSDVNPLHCITMGYEHDNYTSLVMVTRDGFDTFTTLAPPCGYFTDGQVLWLPGTDTVWVTASTNCPGVGVQYIVSTDGGQSFTDWAPPPFTGKMAFTDATHAVGWWDSGVWMTEDTGAHWTYTGHAPAGGGAMRTLQALDTDHAWALGQPDCRYGSAAYVARWVP